MEPKDFKKLISEREEFQEILETVCLSLKDDSEKKGEPKRRFEYLQEIESYGDKVSISWADYCTYDGYDHYEFRFEGPKFEEFLRLFEDEKERRNFDKLLEKS